MSENKAHIVDTFGRTHDYLRISLTEKCNLRCTYCMPEEGVPLKEKSSFMTAEEVVAIAQEFVALGVKKIRLTGGEPLLKKGAEYILTELGKLPVKLTMTTNAVLVDRYLETLKRANISAINVSLDSLQEARFNAISRRAYFTTVWNNIQLLQNEGFRVKINVVLIKGTNDDEINDFIAWTLREQIHIQFIEFMPFDGNDWNREKTVSSKEILQTISSKFGSERLMKMTDPANATSRNYRIEHAPGSFGIISTITNPFCDSCNRIRLTADGKIKNCLFSNDEIDLLTAHRENQPIGVLIQQSIRAKLASRGGIQEFDGNALEGYQNRSMITIGG